MKRACSTLCTMPLPKQRNCLVHCATINSAHVCHAQAASSWHPAVICSVPTQLQCSVSHLIPHCGSSLAELLQEGTEAVGALQPHQACLPSNIPSTKQDTRQTRLGQHVCSLLRKPCALPLRTFNCGRHAAWQAALDCKRHSGCAELPSYFQSCRRYHPSIHQH